MPRYRYEATDQKGIPVHGTADADDDIALAKLLDDRNMKLVSSTVLSLDALISSHHESLPRLYQLRVGEQLREALLSGLPAHEAVRSVAAEPLSHPMLEIAPWSQVMATLSFAAAWISWWLTIEFYTVMLATGVLAIFVVPVAWWVLLQIYHSRPKALLRNLANRLEAGEQLPAQLSLAMPSELKCVMQSDISDDAKARVAADLVPCLLGTTLRTQQFVVATIGPLAMLGTMFAVMYTGMLFIVPHFKSIFEGFGVELPGMTIMIISVSDLIAYFGVFGWLLGITGGAFALILLAVAITRGSVAQELSRIPIFGMPFRWAMQARVARVIASMLRNDCPYPETIRTALAGSEFSRIQTAGKQLATDLESGDGTALKVPELSGLPVSMLFVKGGSSENERRFGMAKTFQSLSEMLDSATLSQGRIFSVMIQFLTISVAAFSVGVVVLAMFLPLIKLLNDLS